MPELPEVESVRRGLAAARVRAPVRTLWRSEHRLRIGKHWREENLEVLVGARPGPVRRRGKHIIWEFFSRSSASNAEKQKPALGLLIHLGMSGRCGIARSAEPRARHTHMMLRFEDDRELRFVDPRRFGGLRAGTLAKLRAAPPLSTLGIEPLDPAFCGAELQTRLGASKRAIRDALLDQHAVAGIGNIYAVEALFIAKIHPLTRATRIRPTAWERLAKALVQVLEQGIANGGTTLKDFRNVVGEVGRNQDDLSVYGRAGQPCPSCGRPLEGFTHGGRSGVLCPVDQARPRGGWVR